MATTERFAFGRPSTECRARMAADASAMVIGVYPSAWHVTWTAPELFTDGKRHGVKAMAVDVEPTVFWDGANDGFGTATSSGSSRSASSTAPMERSRRVRRAPMVHLAQGRLKSATGAARHSRRTDSLHRRLPRVRAEERRHEPPASRATRFCANTIRSPSAWARPDARCRSVSTARTFPRRRRPDSDHDCSAISRPLAHRWSSPPVVRKCWETLVLLSPLAARPPCARFDDLQLKAVRSSRLTPDRWSNSR